MAGNRNLMNHCRNESSGIERYVGTSYDHLVKVSENLDTINFIAANIDSVLEGVIVTQGDIIGQIQEEGKNMLEGIQKDMRDYVTKFEKDIDIVIDEKFSFIDETLSGIIHDSEFAIKQREFEARIGEVEIVIAKEKEANASTRKDLEVKYEDNRAKIEMLDQVVATNEFTMSEFYKKVELEMNGNTGRIEDLSKAIINNEKAWLEKSSYLEGVIGENTTYIKDVQNVLVESNEAIAESLTELDATVGGFSADITTVKKVTADLEKSTAESIERLTSSIKDIEVINNGEQVKMLESEILLERLTETTNTQTATTVNSLQNSVMGANSANLSLQQMTLANESEVRASQTTFLTAGYNDNTANLLLQQTVIANEVSTRASEHRKLTAHFLDNVAEIESFKTVYAKDKEALAETLDTLKSEVNTVIKGDIENLKQYFNSEIVEFKKTYATDKQATAESLENLKSELNTTVKGDIDSLRTQVSSEIETVKGTIAEVEKTSSNLNTTLRSEILAEISRTDLATRESLRGDINTSANDLRKDFDSKLEANKSETDKKMEEVIGTDIKELQNSIFDIGNDISTTNKKITDNKAATDKTIADTKKELLEEVTIKDTRNTNELPAWYFENYPMREVREFKSAKVIGLTTGDGYAELTTSVKWRDSSGGDITQTALYNSKQYIRSGGGKGANEAKWSSWVENESITGSQSKANAAKKSAIEESKKYTDGESDKINTTISAEIKQVNSTIATVDGKVLAMTKLTAETTVLGERVISGLAFGSDSKQANFKIFADNFAIVSTDGRTEVPAFTSTMVAGKAVIGINGDLFVSGSISGNAIKSSTQITSPIIKGGSIEGGSINIGNGNFTVNSNGNLYAKSGVFEGEVYADKIRGDVSEVYTASINSSGYAEVRIPAARHKRRFTILNLTTKAEVFNSKNNQRKTNRIHIYRNGAFMQTFEAFCYVDGSFGNFAVLNFSKAVTYMGSIAINTPTTISMQCHSDRSGNVNIADTGVFQVLVYRDI